ncbi:MULTISPECIES: antibiotic biosynthesis monooxygenase [Bacillaceae]|uniref:antibiotic biosynthesis monooxygenase family protein n=1 Tax=Bacillaceae TaxID=186817 RepID=UPI001E483481|nr:MULTISPECIES: antibiotic biosynthesis monooxygenase [Bacillaceae]MCE4047541.1 antibiotic biosynthesis monooxygenase [Bacillus sp. Au-Bac7]MCM3030818.1 antibiotic biosynthesis monooxygenase [Niallia sp. MER 6]MDL0436151.1 antibiotic biosynthesis monooxygenase [Niallia sp. SS-2023]UPO86111.1 antibiotic biosynthesis monooxygenase [Niallia sp. Man26]
MFIVQSTFPVPDEKALEVIEIYKNRSRLVDKNHGFIRFLLLQNEKNKGEITVHMEWETKEDYLKWVRSTEFKDIHELEKKYPDKELASVIPTVKQFAVVAE